MKIIIVQKIFAKGCSTMHTEVIHSDTIELLKECNAGVKMGVASIDEVLDSVRNNRLREILVDCKERHEKLGNETRELLNKYHDSGKEPSAIAKSMSWMKTNFKLTVDESDKTVADLITDGCNMGVKSLRRYLNKYEAAEEQVKDICKRLISIEENTADDIKEFL